MLSVSMLATLPLMRSIQAPITLGFEGWGVTVAPGQAMPGVKANSDRPIPKKKV